MPKKSFQKGECPVCQSTKSLMSDGTLFRHFAIPHLQPDDLPPTWPEGICFGWGMRPKTVVSADDAPSA